MIRVCIIGAGGHSRSHHGPSLRQLRDERPDEIELAAVIANDRGQSAHLEILPDAGAMEETYELAGSGFFARIDTGAGTLVIHRDGETVVKKDFGDAPPHVSAGAYDETKAFLDAVATGTPFSPDMSDGLPAMRTADAIERGGTTVL